MQTPELLVSKFGTTCSKGIPSIFLKWSLIRHVGISFCISKQVGTNCVFRVWVHNVQPISATYGLGSWLKPSDKISLCAIALLRSCTELGTKTWIARTEANGVYSFDFACAEYGLETLGLTSNGIRLMAFFIKPKVIVVSLETCLSTKDEIRIITNGWQRDCAEYGIQTWHTCFDIQPTSDE
jgi:hypothetical protein